MMVKHKCLNDLTGPRTLPDYPDGDQPEVRPFHMVMMNWRDLLLNHGLEMFFGVILNNDNIDNVIDNVDNIEDAGAPIQVGVEVNLGLEDPLPGGSRRRPREEDEDESEERSSKRYRWWDEFADSSSDSASDSDYDSDDDDDMDDDDFDTDDAAAEVEDPLPSGSRKRSREEDPEEDEDRSSKCVRWWDEFADSSSDDDYDNIENIVKYCR